MVLGDTINVMQVFVVAAYGQIYHIHLDVLRDWLCSELPLVFVDLALNHHPLVRQTILDVDPCSNVHSKHPIDQIQSRVSDRVPVR